MPALQMRGVQARRAGLWDQKDQGRGTGRKAKDDFLSLARRERKTGNHSREKSQTATAKTLGWRFDPSVEGQGIALSDCRHNSWR
jgi:hypothetical protein